VGEQQHRPEAAGLVDEPLDLVARVLGDSDGPDPTLVGEVDHLTDVGVALDAHLRERRHVLEVVEPLLDADSTSRKACSRVSATWNRLTSHHLFRSTVLPNADARSCTTFQWCASASKPSGGQRRADREQADAVPPGQPGPGARRDGGDRDVEQRIGVGAVDAAARR
jgi:hypothetical protein